MHNVWAVHRGIFSTLGDITDFTGGCSVHWGCSVQWGISWVHRGVFSTVGDSMSTLRWYHDECRGISWVHRGMFSTLGFPYKFNCFPNDLPPHLSWYLQAYSWYPPTVLMISPTVLNIPRCTAHPRCTAQTLCRVIIRRLQHWSSTHLRHDRSPLIISYSTFTLFVEVICNSRLLYFFLSRILWFVLRCHRKCFLLKFWSTDLLIILSNKYNVL